MRTVLTLLAFAAVTLLTSEVVRADSIKFCFNGYGAYTDSGIEQENDDVEDAWDEDGYRSVKGANFKVKIGSTTYFDGNLGTGNGAGDPGSGCTTTLTVPSANSTYKFYYYSAGAKLEADGGAHTLDVRHMPIDQDPIDNHEHDMIFTKSHSGGTGTFIVDLLTTNEDAKIFKMHLVGARVFYKRGEDLGPISIDMILVDDGNGSNKWDDNTITIREDSHDRKYLVAHEMGHALAYKAGLAAGLGSGSCSHSDTQCPAGGTHALTSKEYQTCAFTEGFANFISAATWNKITETDCHFKYWGGAVVNCEGTSTHANKYMETECDDTSHTDKGVELDWLKVFWDTQTNGGGISMEDTYDWLDEGKATFPFFWTDPYDQLDSAANTKGGQLNTNWDNVKGANGVDW